MTIGEKNRMKRIYLLLFAISPMVIGYSVNLMALLPGIGILLLYIASIILLIYWFWVGSKFADAVSSPLLAVMGGNFFGILSLFIYYWQFVILDDHSRSMFWAGISQTFTTPLSIFTARIVVFFDKSPNTISQTSITYMYVIGTLIMMAVFTIGYTVGKKKNKSKQGT